MMMGMGSGAGGWLLMILLWAALIVLALGLVRAMFPRAREPLAGRPGREMSATDILDRRYASGEIGRDEYELMKAVLSRGEGQETIPEMED